MKILKPAAFVLAICLPVPSLVASGQVKEALEAEAKARDAVALDAEAQAYDAMAEAIEAWVKAEGNCDGSTARCFEQAAESRERARTAVEGREREQRGAENRRQAVLLGEEGYKNAEGQNIWPDKKYAQEMVQLSEWVASGVRNAAHVSGTNVAAARDEAKHIRILAVQNPPNALRLLQAAQARDAVAQAWDATAQAWDAAAQAYDAAVQAWERAAAQALEQAADP